MTNATNETDSLQFKLRPATEADLPAAMRIVDAAKALLKRDGIPQWQGGKPNLDTLTDRLNKGWLYVLVEQNSGHIAAVSVIMPGPDPNYSAIYDGAWLPNPNQSEKEADPNAYAVFHNTAVAPEFHGHHVGQTLLEALIKKAFSFGYTEFRIDTHSLNRRMQHIICLFPFMYAGNVRMNNDPNDMRRAYQMFM